MPKSLDYNYALDKEFAAKVRDDLMSVFDFCKSDRDEREDRWQEYYRAWSTDPFHSDSAYDGIADVNLPQVRKEVETMTRRLIKGIFPDEYLRAHTNVLANEDLASANTEVVRHYLDNVMKVKSAFMPFIKQGVILGTSPLRSYWHKQVNNQFIRKREFALNKDGVWEPKRTIKAEEVVLYDAPICVVEDMFKTYVYPTNVARVEDLKAVFKCGNITKSALKDKVKKKQSIEITAFEDEAKQTVERDEEEQIRSQLFSESGTMPALERDDGFFNIIEVWTDIKLPDSSGPVPVVVEIINKNHVIRIQRNGFWHQSMPFDFFRYIRPPGQEFYGRGLPEATIKVQQQLNDTLNQGVDSATLSLNNITIVNPAFAPNSDSFEIEPRAVWWADPNGVKQFTFPDLSDTSLKMAGYLRSVISEMSDNQPQLPDPLSGKARSTGQAQLALGEFNTDLQIFLEMIADETLKPFVKKVHFLLQQKLEDDVVIRITPKYSKPWIQNIISSNDIISGFDFDWITSVDSENLAVKNQQLINLFKIGNQLPGVRMNWENLMIKFLRDGMKFRDFHNIIESSRYDDRIDPSIELKLVLMDANIQVNKNDDDDLHILRHTNDLSKIKSDYQKSLLTAHIEAHKTAKAQKQQEAQMQMIQMQLAQGQGKEGNTSQVPESVSESDMNKGMR